MKKSVTIKVEYKIIDPRQIYILCYYEHISVEQAQRAIEQCIDKRIGDLSWWAYRLCRDCNASLKWTQDMIKKCAKKKIGNPNVWALLLCEDYKVPKEWYNQIKKMVKETNKK